MSSPAFVVVQGQRVRVRVAGPLECPPVVLIHGIGRTLDDWAEQFPRLSSRCRLIALDLPGCGFSQRAPQPTTLTFLAQAVVDVLNELSEARPVHLVGNSLGGAVAMQVAVTEPSRVTSLTLVDSAGFGKEVALALRLLAVPLIGEALTARLPRWFARVSERTLFVDPRLATEARVDHALAVSRQPATGSVMLEIARSLATLSGVSAAWRTDLLRAAADLELPTLLVWGDRDRVLPHTHLQSARAAFPKAESELFPGVGHMPQIEVPDAFAERFLDFLGGVPQPTGPGAVRSPSVRRQAE
ncbi:alpha/beta fold hydrolase [Nocardioides sp. NBC_00163]|uniref:alpha/beta fold hydrolase n=1 Tax=Nocardioides sp. NBC_00163 TaxID=2975999 RepID=UPI0032542460